MANKRGQAKLCSAPDIVVGHTKRKAQMKIQWLILSVVVLTFTAFLSLSAAQKPGVTAHIDSSELVVTNHTSEDIYYAIYESESLKLIEWAPVCTDDNRLLPHRSVRLPITPTSYQPSGKAMVFWWSKGKKALRKFSLFRYRSGSKAIR